MEIEQNIPIPPDNRLAYPKHPNYTDVMRELKVGDSFLTHAPKRYSFSTYAKRAGIKITTRRSGEEIRIWRIE